MRAICAWPPATGTGIWAFSFGFVGSVTSMIIVPFGSSALLFSGFGKKVKPGLGTGILLCVPEKAINLPSGY